MAGFTEDREWERWKPPNLVKERTPAAGAMTTMDGMTELMENEPLTKDGFDRLVQIEATMRLESTRRWTFANFCRSDGSPIETVEHVAETVTESTDLDGKPELWGVFLEVDGENKVVCYTGNGPNSERNAQLITFGCNNLATLVDLCMEQRTLLADLIRQRDALREALKTLRATWLKATQRGFQVTFDDAEAIKVANAQADAALALAAATGGREET